MQPQLPSARQQGSTPTGKQLWLQLQDSPARLLLLVPVLPRAELPLPAAGVTGLALLPLDAGVPAAPGNGALALWAPRPALLDVVGLAARPPVAAGVPPAAALRVPAVAALVCAWLALPVFAAGGLLQLVHCENAPLVGEVASMMQARTPRPPFAHVHSARSPGVQASPVKTGAAGAAGKPITCSGSAP